MVNKSHSPSIRIYVKKVKKKTESRANLKHDIISNF